MLRGLPFGLLLAFGYAAVYKTGHHEMLERLVADGHHMGVPLSEEAIKMHTDQIDVFEGIRLARAGRKAHQIERDHDFHEYEYGAGAFHPDYEDHPEAFRWLDAQVEGDLQELPQQLRKYGIAVVKNVLSTATAHSLDALLDDRLEKVAVRHGVHAKNLENLAGGDEDEVHISAGHGPPGNKVHFGVKRLRKLEALSPTEDAPIVDLLKQVADVLREPMRSLVGNADIAELSALSVRAGPEGCPAATGQGDARESAPECASSVPPSAAPP